MLRRYWFEFEGTVPYSNLNLGCGITAYDKSDALKILEKRVFPLFEVRKIAKIVEDIDIRTLEESHVRPNMGSPVVHGVWFPKI
jgi:hypothetical protein